MKVKKILAVTTISTVAAAGLASAQSTSSQITQPMSIYGEVLSLFKGNKKDPHTHQFGKGRNNMQGKNERKAIEDSIISGDYAQFLLVASTSPLKGLSQESFNLLTPQFQAKKNAEEQIRKILTDAGIESKGRPSKPVQP